MEPEQACGIRQASLPASSHIIFRLQLAISNANPSKMSDLVIHSFEPSSARFQGLHKKFGNKTKLALALTKNWISTWIH